MRRRVRILKSGLAELGREGVVDYRGPGFGEGVKISVVESTADAKIEARMVSFQRSNAGISWVRHPGDYANPIPTTPARRHQGEPIAAVKPVRRRVPPKDQKIFQPVMAVDTVWLAVTALLFTIQSMIWPLPTFWIRTSEAPPPL